MTEHIFKYGGNNSSHLWLLQNLASLPPRGCLNTLLLNLIWLMTGLYQYKVTEFSEWLRLSPKKMRQLPPFFLEYLLLKSSAAIQAICLPWGCHTVRKSMLVHMVGPYGKGLRLYEERNAWLPSSCSSSTLCFLALAIIWFYLHDGPKARNIQSSHFQIPNA